jgi:hypothetical protein
VLAIAAWLLTAGIAAAATTTLPSRPKAAHHSWAFLVVGAGAGMLALVLAVPPKATFSRLVERRRVRAQPEPDGAPTPPAPAAAGGSAETCVVRWGEGILASHFYAEARGPRGRYVAGRSATFAFDGPEPPRRSDIVAAHERLLARLAKRGWRLSAESGDGPWWERRLARGRAR